VQEVDVVLTRDHIVTVRKTPPDGPPFDMTAVHETCGEHPDNPAVVALRIVDSVAEGFLVLIDRVDDELGELEEGVDHWPADRVRRRISELRRDLLKIRRLLGPSRDAVRKVVDGRITLESEDERPLDRDVQVHFVDAYDKLLQATEALEFARDLLGTIRDYHQSQIATEQNEVVKRLTVVASLLLVPTFIVGIYGQNFTKNFPEIHWRFGYVYSWALIVAATVLQLWFYRRKRWI
jgi:magnesium transporter